MSGNKSSRRHVPKFTLEDVDKFVLFCKRKAEKKVVDSEYGHEHSDMDRRAASSTKTDAFPKAFKNIHEDRVRELESIIASLYIELSGKDQENKNLMRQLAELGTRHDYDMAEQTDLLEDTICLLRGEATRAILKARLKMAGEAFNPSFDRSQWDIAGWRKTLEVLDKEEVYDLYEVMLAEVLELSDDETEE